MSYTNETIRRCFLLVVVHAKLDVVSTNPVPRGRIVLNIARIRASMATPTRCRSVSRRANRGLGVDATSAAFDVTYFHVIQR